MGLQTRKWATIIFPKTLAHSVSSVEENYGHTQSLRASILSYVRIRVSMREQFSAQDANALSRLNMQLRACGTSSSSSNDQIMDRVVTLVKKFSSIDAAKVTETADFQKDLSLDSLDGVELVMAFEQEFSIEIPDEEADKLKCCADVAKYIMSESSS